MVNILVLLRMVPDVVEELEIAPGGKALDPDALRMIPSESDDHALEQALLLKEAHGGNVTVIAPEAPEVDEALFAALAKGASRAVKLEGLEPDGPATTTAAAFARAIQDTPDLLPADLILTGVQSWADLDGLIAPLVARRLDLPHAGIVTSVTVKPAAQCAEVLKEYAGGVRGEFEVPLPAVLGIQAADRAPRYVPVARVRAAMKSQRIESVDAAAEEQPPRIEVLEMKRPEAAGHAEMLEGDAVEVAERLCEIFASRGLV